MVKHDPREGDFLLHRDVYVDPAYHRLEFDLLFKKNWIYVAHESQIPDRNDFIVEQIGDTSVIIARNKVGGLSGLVNRCSHRGALLCRESAGNATSFTCMFHAWTFANDGRLIGVPDRGRYPPQFDKNRRSLDVVARVESYRGLIFASLNPDVPTLETHLGKARPYLDFILDKHPEGIEVAPGQTNYQFPANWKLQVENSLDFYHVPFVHRSFFDVLRRAGVESGKSNAREMESDHAFYLGNGHGTVVLEEHGERFQHLLLFPNLIILENPAPQFRKVRPLACDRTEVTGRAYFPKGLSPARRAEQLRRYEMFYGPMGLGTPDDAEAFIACQAGLSADGCTPWVDLSRGLGRDGPEITDPIGEFEEAGNITDDTVFRGIYRHLDEALAPR